MTRLELSVADVDRCLRDRDEAVTDIPLLKGGAWSTAFSFVALDRALVVRFGQHVEDDEKDRLAGTWAHPGLPTPTVIEIGAAFGGAFAVSHRLQGDKLDTLPAARLALTLDSLSETLGALRGVTPPGVGQVVVATVLIGIAGN